MLEKQTVLDMGHLERKERAKKILRKNIMDAALAIAVKEGWASVTIRKIAEIIEYTPPIVYEHFKNKDNLLDELVLYGHRKLNKGIDLALKTESDSKKRLMFISLHHWDFAFKQKELYQLMFNLERIYPNEEILSTIQTIRSLFQKLTLDSELAEELMFSWMCLQNGYIFNIMKMELPPELSKKEPKQLFKNAIERFLNGL